MKEYEERDEAGLREGQRQSKLDKEPHRELKKLGTRFRSDLQWQEVLLYHPNPLASLLQPRPRPQRIGESPGNMTTYELKLWIGARLHCEAVF